MNHKNRWLGRRSRLLSRGYLQRQHSRFARIAFINFVLKSWKKSTEMQIKILYKVIFRFSTILYNISCKNTNLATSPSFEDRILPLLELFSNTRFLDLRVHLLGCLPAFVANILAMMSDCSFHGMRYIFFLFSPLTRYLLLLVFFRGMSVIANYSVQPKRTAGSLKHCGGNCYDSWIRPPAGLRAALCSVYSVISLVTNDHILFIIRKHVLCKCIFI